MAGGPPVQARHRSLEPSWASNGCKGGCFVMIYPLTSFKAFPTQWFIVLLLVDTVRCPQAF